jgi:fluoride ion exporter CrcB/FEX
LSVANDDICISQQSKHGSGTYPFIAIGIGHFCAQMEGKESDLVEGYGCQIEDSMSLFPNVMGTLSGTDVFSSLMTPRQTLERSTTSDTLYPSGEVGLTESDGEDRHPHFTTSTQKGNTEAGVDPYISHLLQKFTNQAPFPSPISKADRGTSRLSVPTRAPHRSRSARTNSSGSVDDVGSEKSTHKILITRSYQVKEHYLETVFYISISAILGSAVRTFMARLFGKDCEVQLFTDFLTPFSSLICVTNGGRTLQTGGALFYDFPANVVGSLIMGLITPGPSEHRTRIPWLHREHPLQRDDVFLESLGIGFCGCLTTFSSWNTQMVVMLDGTYCELGPQVVPALFGYALGFMGAYCAFQFGRQTGLWMYNIKHAGEGELEQLSWEDEMEKAALYADSRTAAQQGVELVDDVEMAKLKPIPNHAHKIPLLLAAVGLLIAFTIAGFKNDIPYYKGMTLSWFASPVGSLLRWRLSELNVRTGKGRCTKHLPAWVPWGTVCANVIAAMLGAIMTGLDDRFFSSSTEYTFTEEWVSALLFAINTGLAGSLSTVSTLIKEAVVLLEEHDGQAKSHCYAFGTCFFSMLLGLALYSTTVRINS